MDDYHWKWRLSKGYGRYDGPLGAWDIRWLSEGRRTEISGPLSGWIDWGPNSISLTRIESVPGGIGNSGLVVRQEARWSVFKEKRALRIETASEQIRLVPRTFRPSGLESAGDRFAVFGVNRIRVQADQPIGRVSLAILIHASGLQSVTVMPT